MTSCFRVFPIIAFTLALLFGACSDDDSQDFFDQQDSSERESVIVYRDETRFIDDLTNDVLESMSETQLVFSANTEVLESIQAGDIMVSTKANQFQDHGYIYRVINKTESGAQTIFEVEQAYVTDYIIYADVYMEWAFEEGPGKTDQEFCMGNLEVKLQPSWGPNEEPPVEEQCTAFGIDETLNLNAAFSTEQLCTTLDFDFHIRPINDIYSECIRAHLSNSNHGGNWVSRRWDNFRTGLEAVSCELQDIEENALISRVGGVSMTFGMEGPESNVSLNVEGQLSIYFPIMELIPTALKESMSGVLDIVDIDIISGLYTGAELKGSAEISQDFSMSGTATVSKGEEVPEKELSIDVSRTEPASLSLGGSVKYDFLKFETGVRIFGKGGCGSLAAFGELNTGPGYEGCQSLQVGFEAQADLSFRFLDKLGFTLQAQLKKTKDIFENDCQVDLSGNWTAVGYAPCDGGPSFPQELSIVHDLESGYLVATKVTGGLCVPAGDVSFRGDYDGYTTNFEVTFTLGTSDNPSSVLSTPQTMEVLDESTLELEESTFQGTSVTFSRKP